jgi:hypothetical protein
VLSADTHPRTPGRPTWHSNQRNFYRSTLLGYQCFALDTWLFGREVLWRQCASRRSRGNPCLLRLCQRKGDKRT